MSLTHDTAHAAEARARLCQQFKGNIALEAILDTGSGAAQAVEDALWQLQTLRLPWSAATGVQLDGIGDIVGQPRNNLDDAHYRLWLQARLMANASGGAPETLIGIATLVTGAVVHLKYMGPGAIVLDIDGALDPTVDPVTLAAILGDAVAGGVDCQLVYSLSANADTFTFASGDTVESDVLTTTYASGSGLYTVPADGYIDAIVIAAGGQGGDNGGGGGEGGACVTATIAVTAGQQIAYAVGAGTSGAGGDSSFGATLIAKGGAAGAAGPHGAGGTGDNAATSTGTVKHKGGSGYRGGD